MSDNPAFTEITLDPQSLTIVGRGVTGALHWGRKGFPVVPLCACGRLLVCAVSTDPECIHRWWMRWPHGLIGVPTNSLIEAHMTRRIIDAKASIELVATMWLQGKIDWLEYKHLNRRVELEARR